MDEKARVARTLRLRDRTYAARLGSHTSLPRTVPSPTSDNQQHHPYHTKLPNGCEAECGTGFSWRNARRYTHGAAPTSPDCAFRQCKVAPARTNKLLYLSTVLLGYVAIVGKAVEVVDSAASVKPSGDPCVMAAGL
ncbi:hypothetical protein IG631_00837 [Alternaria alternata]|nr:hypothetical protein IG631_00837 [Alternaria alternata]